MQNTFVESMKTIARLAVDKAGFDKTRTGKIVAVNSVTNTYSVKVDGIIYNNIKTVNDSTYNVGDTVKVNIPMNNPSQSYIASSILSDESFGNKIAKATSAIEAVDERIDGVVEIMGRIYQLSIGITYENRMVGSGTTAVTYTDATYTAILIQDGEDVTSTRSASEFNWYLEKITGKTRVGANVKTITLSSEQYLYGQSVILEWSYDGEVKLRARVTLFDESAIEQIAKYTTEITDGGVFVHRADGIYDVGANWESPNAYGVKITESVDIVKGGEIYGSFGGTYMTIGNTSKNNIYMDSSGFIQLRNSSTILADIRSNSITLGRTASSYYNVYMDTQHLYFRYGTDILTNITDSSITLGRSTAGYYSTLINSSSIQFRYNDNGIQRIVGEISSSGMTLRNSSNIVLMSLHANALNLYNGNSSNNINVASFGNGGITLKDTNNRVTFEAKSNNMKLYYYNSSIGNIDIMALNTSGMVLKNASNIPIFELVNSNSQIISRNKTNTNEANYQVMYAGANGGTYGQPGIELRKRYSNGGWSEFEFRLNDTQQGGQITNTNEVAITGSNWTHSLYAARNGIFVYGSFYNYSDRRLKKHIRYLNEDESMTFIRNLRPALFYKDNVKDIGLYAQDVEEIDEWNVFTHVKEKTLNAPDNMLTLDYLGLIMPLIKCCQQLDKRVKELEQKE